MNIKIVSDIHLESNPKFLIPDDENIREQETILVLAGDIVPVAFIESYRKFFVDACCRFQNVIYVPGNHEYYHSNINEVDDAFLDFFGSDVIFDNLHYLNKKKIEIHGITFLCCTLWTDCDKENPITMSVDKNGLADYNWIFQGSEDGGEQRLSTATTVAIHKDHLSFLENELKVCDPDTTMVITHHSPSYQSSPKRFIGDKLTPFFHSSLENLILDYQPKFWIHGHIHDAVDYHIDNTRIICNPLGYNNPFYATPENVDWNPFLVVSL